MQFKVVTVGFLQHASNVWAGKVSQAFLLSNTATNRNCSPQLGLQLLSNCPKIGIMVKYLSGLMRPSPCGHYAGALWRVC